MLYYGRGGRIATERTDCKNCPTEIRFEGLGLMSPAHVPAPASKEE